MSSGQNDNDVVNDEVQKLRNRAKAIRDSIPEEKLQQQIAKPDGKNQVEDTTKPSQDYRLYLDIGRENGTWMEPRWGASGKRIECTIDVSFLTPPSSSESGNTADDDGSSLAGSEVISKMVNDNKFGKSSIVRIIDSAPTARLRGGFDKMNCSGGGYRIDATDSGGQARYSSSTLRFYIEVDGTLPRDGGSNLYGDISIPEGRLYFSLPCFGSGVGQLSTKEGIVTVRQTGWHTGWRREESRIVGVFRASSMDVARKRDKF